MEIAGTGEGTVVNTTTQDHARIRFKIHWHVILTHFPIAFFTAAFGFQVLHLFIAPECFELSTNVALIGGAIMMVPTALSGWLTWKGNYHGANAGLFRIKIITAFILLILSFALVIWRSLFLGLFVQLYIGPAHFVYLAGNTLLIAGSIIEGYYGGLLNHR